MDFCSQAALRAKGQGLVAVFLPLGVAKMHKHQMDKVNCLMFVITVKDRIVMVIIH